MEAPSDGPLVLSLNSIKQTSHSMEYARSSILVCYVLALKATSTNDAAYLCLLAMFVFCTSLVRFFLFVFLCFSFCFFCAKVPSLREIRKSHVSSNCL